MTVLEAFENQTKVINESERIRISRKCPGDKIVTNFFPDIKHNTLHCLFQRGLKIAGDKPCLGYRKPAPKTPTNHPSNTNTEEREYQWLSYNQVNNHAQSIGSALVHFGHCPRQEEKIGIYGSNRWEWDVTQIANNAFSFVTVPLYDTLGLEAITHIVSITEMKTVVCDTEDKIKRLLKCRHECPDLSLVVVMESVSSEIISQAKQEGLKVVTFEHMLETGRVNRHAFVPPEDENSLSLILFTSGTTGMPKGVMLSNLNMVSDVGAVLDHYAPIQTPTNDDSMISYLPQAHGFNQVLTQCMLSWGARVGYLSGSVLQLLDDVKALRPTLFPIVPRLMNKIYDSIWQRASKSTVKKYLLRKAYEAKKTPAEQRSFRPQRLVG